MPQLVDGFGRVHRDLRISVTDRCNFRCTYCMPEEGMDWVPREELLSFEEIERIARVLVDTAGVSSVRLTGGEPTMRAHLERLVSKLSALGAEVALTTNGATLASHVDAYASAGLHRINISLDSLRADRFRTLTRRDSLDSVIDGIRAARGAGLDPVKVNVVAMRGVNDDEVLDFAEFGRREGVEVRFIEFMPLDADRRWNADDVVSQDEILAVLRSRYDLVDVPRDAAPAERFRFIDLDARRPGAHVGVIPSVTKPFCGSCDRIRLTSDGRLRTCLFAVDEVDLRAVLRSGGTDADLLESVRAAVATKWAGHSIGQVHFIRPSRSMSQIGG